MQRVLRGCALALAIVAAAGATPAAARTSAAVADREDTVRVFDAEPLDEFALEAGRALRALRERLAPKFVWPAKGLITTHFGGGHDGIDIDGEYGDPIRATRSGRVTYAGDDGDGYGLKLVIKHGDGTAALYSHLARLDVKRGDEVGQSQFLGTMGCTGSCSGDHLHFEIFVRGREIDPLERLPK